MFVLTLQGNQQVALLRHNPITKVSSTLCCRILSIKVNYAILRQQISLHDKHSTSPARTESVIYYAQHYLVPYVNLKAL